MAHEPSHPAGFDRRRAGILLHPTSLPGTYGTGDLGPDAYRFIDWLVECGISVWQMLPVTPPGPGGSPYLSSSVHAGNAMLISLELLAREGWLEEHHLAGEASNHAQFRRAGLHKAWQGFVSNAKPQIRDAYEKFVDHQRHWLQDFALFQALHEVRDFEPWQDWPAGLRDRRPAALDAARQQLTEQIDSQYLQQFLFYWQWQALKAYAGERGVQLFGDMPIFVAADSAEVWMRPDYFDLDGEGHPNTVAGVPPDYFSSTGQHWGNPHYDWQRMREDDFQWWRDRISAALLLFDLVRIDHFRGFEAYWSIPGGEKTAENGHWVEAPGEELFASLRRHLGHLPLIAEDLGTLTEGVHELRRKFGLPGMRVLQFAFDGAPDNPYLPHNHDALSVVYTGTHDNDTTAGWFEALDVPAREYILEVLGQPGDEMPWALIRSAMASVAGLAVIPMQDVLGLGSEHRMNTPNTVTGNWQWQFEWGQINEGVTGRLRHLVGLYGRYAW